jgi:SAM-dependent methyltransferase
MLPDLDMPRILDIGCGSGVVTLELARLSGGDIIALDIDKTALDRLTAKAGQKNEASRITVMCASMKEMMFTPGSFDIIWTEGSISVIGFENGLREWRDLLVPEGYLVIHDVLLDSRVKIESAHRWGYTIVGQFELSQSVWWNKYYLPLKERLAALKANTPKGNPVIENIKMAEREIREFDFENDLYASFFLILKKTQS